MTQSNLWLYFATCKGFTKIGVSIYPWSRIGEMQTANPFNIRPYHYFYISENDWVEKVFHEIFADKRIKGEWFKISRLELEEVKRTFDTGELESPTKLNKVQLKKLIDDFKERRA